MPTLSRHSYLILLTKLIYNKKVVFLDNFYYLYNKESFMKKINNYTDFLKENKLRYYSFDWDDNILHMSTPIHMDKLIEEKWQPISVLPSEFAIVRNDSNYRNRENNPSKAYEEFRDVGPRGNKAFINDVINSIRNNKFGPSWNKFIKCLVEGSLFAIVTARGHEYNTLKEGVKYIIDSCLTKKQGDLMYQNCQKFLQLFESKTFKREIGLKLSETKLINYYLDKCKFYGVGFPFSKSFHSEFHLDETIKIEEAKKIALDKFLSICHNYGKQSDKHVSVGFSDDDKKNVEHVKKFFEFKSTIYDRMKLNVYDTSDKVNSHKTQFKNGITEDMGPSISGKESSILRFMGPNSMPNTLQNATNDWSQPNYTLLQKSKVANLLTKDSVKKKVKLKKKNAKSKSNNNPA